MGFIPAVPCLAARMPFRGLLSMTVSIMRTYPRLLRQLKEEVRAGRTTDDVIKVRALLVLLCLAQQTVGAAPKALAVAWRP